MRLTVLVLVLAIAAIWSAPAPQVGPADACTDLAQRTVRARPDAALLGPRVAAACAERAARQPAAATSQQVAAFH